MRAWLWRTFVYDQMWQPARWAQWAWVKTRGYPLPQWLQPPFLVDGFKPLGDGTDLHSMGAYWTPWGQRREAWSMRRRGFFVERRVGR